MTITQTQLMFNKLIKGRLPEQLKFFSDGSSRGGSELKISAVEKTGMLNENKNAFIEYLTTDYAREILAKNKMEILLETGNIYNSNINMREKIYDFFTRTAIRTEKTYGL